MQILYCPSAPPRSSARVRSTHSQRSLTPPGTDVTLVAHSLSVAMALEAAEALQADGISAEVINLRSIRPLDVPTVQASVEKTHRLVIVESGWPTFGVGAEISAAIVESRR